jgi:hypothetical protein
MKKLRFFCKRLDLPTLYHCIKKFILQTCGGSIFSVVERVLTNTSTLDLKSTKFFVAKIRRFISNF